jgi:two-component system, cell cycle sensor histidine kinase and response regulator CckA
MLHAVLAGFFAFGAVQYFAQWCRSRRERVLLVFALHCALGALHAIILLSFSRATTIAGAQTALDARTTVGLLWVAMSVWLVSRITGLEARTFVRAAAGVLVTVAVANFFSPVSGTVTAIDLAQTPWGETVTVARRPPPAWLGWIYAVIFSVFVFGLAGAVRLWKRDRVSAALAAVASGGGLLAYFVALLADTGRLPMPYVGDLPAALWAVLMAALLSREYAERGERLAVSERRFRAVFDQASEMVFLTRLDGTLTHVNRAALAAAGVAEQAVVGRAIWETPWWAHDPQLQERLRAVVRDAERGSPVQFEATHPRQDGTRSSVECSMSVARDDRAEATMLVFESRDVTERVRAHEALRLSGARYRTMIESAPEAIVVLDIETGKFVDCNQKACEMFGVSVTGLRELGPLDVSALVQPDGRDSTIAASGFLAEAIAGGQPVFEWMHRTVGGRDIPCEVCLVRLPDPDRVLIRGSMTDITDRRLLEDQLRQSQKMEAVGRLAGGVAHDFNNLLTVITLSSHMLLEEMEAGVPHAGHVQDIADAADRASALTQQLLAFGRKAVLAPKVLDVNAVVRDAEKMLRRLIGEDVELTVALDPLAWPVTMDRGQLGQVLMNLSVNARDAMPVGGRLVIDTANVDLTGPRAPERIDASPGRYVRLNVADTGAGMSSDVIGHIFEPFFTSKGVGKGTGLGLAVVHSIVEQSGGHIVVESEPGAGTTFSIYLPASEEGIGASREAARAAPTRGHETILLVEDEASLRNLAARALRARGFNVLLAGDGTEALRLLETYRGPIDLLATDVVMPNMDGRELADRLRVRIPGLKVLFLSGYMDDALLRRGVFQADETLLQKPFTPSSLAQRVREVLDFV